MRIAIFNLQNLRLRIRDGHPVPDGAADQNRSKMFRPTDLARADGIETEKVIASAQADIIAGGQLQFDVTQQLQQIFV